MTGARNGAKNGAEDRAENGRENGPETSAEAAAQTRTFEVWRQDDNGNRFLVSRHSDRAAAEAAVTAIEVGVPHKQLYYVKAAESTPRPKP
jgi:hypothetical protein